MKNHVVESNERVKYPTGLCKLVQNLVELLHQGKAWKFAENYVWKFQDKMLEQILVFQCAHTRKDC